MIRAVLRYTDCTQDDKNVFRVLTENRIPSMKKFFEVRPYVHMDKDAELEYICLYDRKGVVKEY